MAMRLQEVHPALVHAPITLFPLAVGADLLGRATGNEFLLETGRRVMPLAAAAAAVAAVFGLVAQEAVKTEGPTHDMLITHRNLNLGFVGVAAAMAAWRTRHDRPSAVYLALGLLGIGTMTYTAYLGGHMVYEHGVGVKAAGGLREEHAPELAPDRLGEAARTVIADLRHGTAHAAEHIGQGEIAPTLMRRGGQNEPALGADARPVRQRPD